MATPGSNLVFTGHEKIVNRVLAALRIRVNRRETGTKDSDATETTRLARFSVKSTGAPATNTANDAPSGLNDVCYDSTNSAVYRCTAYTNGTTFTWTKIST